MVFGKTAFAGLFAVLLAGSGAASAAEPIDCMAQSYDAGQLAKIDEASKGFSVDESDNDRSQEFADIAIAASADCADQQGWDEDRLYYALIYEIGRLSEAAYRRSGAMTADELAKLDTALAKQDRTELWRIIEKSVVATLNGDETELTKSEETKLGLFAVVAGIGTDEEVGERVGVLLGLMGVQRYARREFEALETKE